MRCVYWKGCLEITFKYYLITYPTIIESMYLKNRTDEYRELINGLNHYISQSSFREGETLNIIGKGVSYRN